MNQFESTLTSALQAEADRSTLTLDTMDGTARLEARLDQIDRDRRHRVRKYVLTAAAAVLVAGAVYGVIKAGEPTSTQPAHHLHTRVHPYPDNINQITPGTYQMPVAAKGHARAVGATLTLHGVWHDNNYPVLHGETGYGAVAVYRPTQLAAGTGCLNGKANNHVGRTQDKLAQQLSRLPHSTLLQQPAHEVAFGRDAIHLRVRIDQHCGPGIYRVAMTARDGHGISYGNTSRDVIMDFWVIDVGGGPVVVDKWHQVGSSSRLIQQISRTEKSIKFVKEP